MTKPGPPDTGLTENLLLGGRLRLYQPKDGVRVTTDTLLLAAAVPARPGERVIEAGSGSGGAALALAARIEGVTVAGIDSDRQQVDLANRNAALNGLEERVGFSCASVADRSGVDGRGGYDHAFANPPYFEADSCSSPPAESRARAFVEREASLKDWVAFALDQVKHKGSISFIHRADRLDALIALLYGRAGEIALCPLWPRVGVPAKRVIVQARKGMKGAAMMLPGLVLHESDGRFTPEVEAILRAAMPLRLGRDCWQKRCHSGKSA